MQFAPPFNARTIFDQTVSQGYPATALWWPAMFPARVRSPVQTLPGLGTPDILGRLGVGTRFTTNAALAEQTDRKIPVVLFKKTATGQYHALLAGPMRKRKGKIEPATLDVLVESAGSNGVRLTVGGHKLYLRKGEWSPIIELSFKVSLFFSVKAITQFTLTDTEPNLALYALPLQIHPLASPWHYGTPRNFVKRSWEHGGPFLTLGWPQDTTALEEGCITDEQFLSLCESVVNVRERVLMYHLERFQEGVLAAVFDTLDRIQHMFWRDRPDVVESWYERMDRLVGRVEERLAQQQLLGKTKILVLSDHGFAPFDFKVHLNRWLMEKGYLVIRNGNGKGSFADIDWSRTRAYAIGLNSLYVNLAGREGQGCVSPAELTAVKRQLCADLQAWVGPNGRSVVQNAVPQEEAFDGPLATYGPDVLVGYSPGYRASSETGLGNWHAAAIEPNRDHWGADHCISPDAVPGVIFCSHGLADFSQPSYRDIPALTINAAPDDSQSTPPPTSSGGEDEQVIAERLKGLGYL
ncbi:MAG: hypothetical protein D6706_00450 [Chloroflexi bacterium]|nr:MAG: hypothetical protein D6706_00450 [Chloroflexota bacterium]